MEADPYHLRCLPTHIALLVELGKKNDLFVTAHRLVDNYPELPLTWFAVGCYYLLTKQHDHARRHFRCGNEWRSLSCFETIKTFALSPTS